MANLNSSGRYSRWSTIYPCLGQPCPLEVQHVKAGLTVVPEGTGNFIYIKWSDHHWTVISSPSSKILGDRVSLWVNNSNGNDEMSVISMPVYETGITKLCLTYLEFVHYTFVLCRHHQNCLYHHRCYSCNNATTVSIITKPLPLLQLPLLPHPLL